MGSNTAVQLSLTLKTYGLDVENNNNQGLMANFKASWKRTGSNYLFYVTPSFSMETAENDKFKTTIAFCKANNYKYIVVTNEDSDDLSLFGEDARNVGRMGYKVVLLEKVKELYGEMMALR